MIDLIPPKSYDIVFTLSTYKSTNVAVNFMRSLKNFSGEVLPILVAPRVEDITSIHSIVPEIPAIYIKSDVNSLHFSRAWGFVWAVNNGVIGRYLCSCDDDIYFHPSANKIIERLDKAKENPGFSLMAFSSNHPAWSFGSSYDLDKMKVGVEWVDGNCIFSNWDDNLKYGVIDATTSTPLLYYVELEYSHRMRFLTKKPIVFDQSDVFYNHVFRSDPDLNSARDSVSGNALSEGSNFWRTKFGLNYDLTASTGIHEQIYNQTTRPEFSNNYDKNVMFGGCKNDWEDIYNRYSSGCKVVYDTRS